MGLRCFCAIKNMTNFNYHPSVVSFSVVQYNCQKILKIGLAFIGLVFFSLHLLSMGILIVFNLFLEKEDFDSVSVSPTEEFRSSMFSSFLLSSLLLNSSLIINPLLLLQVATGNFWFIMKYFIHNFKILPSLSTFAWFWVVFFNIFIHL